MGYNHTQTGYLMLFSLVLVFAVFGAVLVTVQFNEFILAMMVLVILIQVSFSHLNVKVDSKEIRIKFGWGIFRKSFQIKEIKSVKSVRNHWYYGWGIRFYLWPRMWIYNVSGFDAVELIMKNGKRYRIGTDEPKKLERAILEIIKR